MEKCIEALNMAIKELERAGYDDEAMKVADIISEIENEYSSESSNPIEKEEKNMQESGNYERGKHSGILIEIKSAKGK